MCSEFKFLFAASVTQYFRVSQNEVKDESRILDFELHIYFAIYLSQYGDTGRGFITFGCRRRMNTELSIAYISDS